MSDDITGAEEAGEDKGEGKETYPFGEYEGGRDEDLNRHGFGSALLPNGDIYEGEYIHGQRYGKGMYAFKNGARYSGMWKRGLKHGHGEFLYPDGSKYVGDWKKDFKHGIGTYTYPNGDIYEGCWYEGWRHGLGTYFFKALEVSFYGTWKEGRMEGPGIYNYAYYRYHGTFEKNLPKGAGCFIFDCKYMQHGFFINIRDPKFDYLGIQELNLEKNPDGSDNRGNLSGIVPIWRARSITEYRTELLPPEPIPIPVREEEESMQDIIQYLEKHHDVIGAEDDERITTSPVPPDLDIPDIDIYNI
ncbi:unnamed protein product [Phyllotreta striolata]|uniref:Radial spoke head 1 homolog n=1 Tax=Phyllotreta striolata TaxID=444603 RepID=A0A9N9XRX6_PHYSR|nr:unnamed protein product [Phyllotreta striolata]